MESDSYIRRLAMVGAFGCANLAGFASATGIVEPPRPSGMAGKLIAHYHMQPIPVEGAWFSVTYSTDDSIDGAALPARYGGRQHAAGSAIVVVETCKDFSALHRLNTDELWHFYSGSPLKMLLLYPDGHGRGVTLGANVLAGESPQVTVPHGVWQGSVPGASSATSYSFVGTQMSPAFDAADFEIGNRDELQRRYPAFSKEIALLTRAEFAGGPAALAAAVEQPGLRAAAFSAANVPQSTMAPGASSGTSLNRRALEVFLVTQGSGQVHLGNEVTSVSADSTVFIPPEVPHSIEAGADSLMEFYAVSAPAFAPEDYVLVKP